MLTQSARRCHVCSNGLREIVKRVGVTTIIVTHDQEEAWDLADHVVIFNKGAIEQEGTPEVRHT